jgi:acyl-CoA synthetase (AMP-forming)/AMP-acid ligase II
MEATTAPRTTESTGSRTIADLLPKAAEKFGDKTAVKYLDKASGEWREVAFREVGEIVRDRRAA